MIQNLILSVTIILLAQFAYAQKNIAQNVVLIEKCKKNLVSDEELRNAHLAIRMSKEDNSLKKIAGDDKDINKTLDQSLDDAVKASKQNPKLCSKVLSTAEKVTPANVNGDSSPGHDW